MKHTITIKFDDAINTLRCGLRVGWLSGERGKGKRREEIDLSCGAGTGSPWLIFSKTARGKTVYVAADIRKILPQLERVADKLLKEKK